MEYSKEQIADITAREKAALEYLKSVNLNPAASVQKQNLGNDVFVDKVIPYLADTKYTPLASVKSDEVHKDDKPVESDK